MKTDFFSMLIDQLAVPSILSSYIDSKHPFPQNIKSPLKFHSEKIDSKKIQNRIKQKILKRQQDLHSIEHQFYTTGQTFRMFGT